MLTTKEIKESFPKLGPSTIRKHAPKCPGSLKLGRDWVFKNNKKTDSFFKKLEEKSKPRKHVTKNK